jgi:hypothetical protein
MQCKNICEKHGQQGNVKCRHDFISSTAACCLQLGDMPIKMTQNFQLNLTENLILNFEKFNFLCSSNSFPVP